MAEDDWLDERVKLMIEFADSKIKANMKSRKTSMDPNRPEASSLAGWQAMAAVGAQAMAATGAQEDGTPPALSAEVAPSAEANLVVVPKWFSGNFGVLPSQSAERPAAGEPVLLAPTNRAPAPEQGERTKKKRNTKKMEAHDAGSQ